MSRDLGECLHNSSCLRRISLDRSEDTIVIVKVTTACGCEFLTQSCADQNIRAKPIKEDFFSNVWGATQNLDSVIVHLYEKHGFALTHEMPGTQCGTNVIEQEFERK